MVGIAHPAPSPASRDMKRRERFYWSVLIAFCAAIAAFYWFTAPLIRFVVGTD